MLPNNFVGQPGLPQSQPQPGPQQGMPNMTIDQRMWLQQQQQFAQLRAQQQANGGQIPQQMLDMIRTRTHQGNPQAMAQQRSFGGGMPQMGVTNSPFPHDPSQGMQNAQPQFGNGQNFGNPLHLQGIQRNPAAQMFANQGGPMRQLDLMMAQNQQNQNGLPNQNMAAALQRQFAQQQQQQSQTQQPQPSQMSGMGAPQLPPGIFGNMAMPQNLQNMQQHNPMGPNRATSVMVSQMPDGQMQGQQPARRPITLAEMQLKASEFKNAIMAGESRIKSLRDQAVNNHLPQESVAQEISKVQKELMERRQALQKIMQILRANSANGAANGAFSNGMDMKGLTASPGPPQRVAGAPQNAQIGWMQNPSQPQFNSPRPMSSPAAHLVSNQTSQPQPPQMSTPQLPQMVASQQNQPQRTVPTPMPMINGVQAPPGGGQPVQRPNSLNIAPVTFQYGPLTRENFTKAYFQQWVPKHPIDQSILSLDGRNIDLWALHAEVMGMNGYRCFVQQTGPNQPGQILCNLIIPPEQWPIIAGRLGFVNFPGDAREPAKSGPVVAIHLERVYKQCLQEFDSQYLRQVIHHRKMMVLGQQKANGVENGGSSIGPQGLSDIKDPKAISEIINYANLSVQELQARGVQPHIIALVEKHRDQLKSTLETQRTFAQGIQNATPQGQPRNVSNPAMNNPMLHPQAGMNMANAMNGVGRPPMQPGQPPQPMNMASTSTMAPNGQPQQRQGGGALIPIAATGRPTQAQTTAAIDLVRRLKEENKHVGFPNARPLHIPDAQRLEYNAQFERLHRLVTALDQKLPHFAVCMKEEVIKKLVVMIHAVQQQREALASNPTQYYMPLTWVVAMINQVTTTDQVFHQWVNNAMRASQQADANQPSGVNAAAQPGPSNHQIRPPALPPARPPTAQTVRTSAAPSPPGPPARTPVASGASPQGAMTPSISKKQTPKPLGDVASASTPAHASPPQTPKSPKNKSKPKAPSKARKPSTKVTSVSSPNAGPSEMKAPVTPAAAATPVSAPTPEPSTGSKRPREEEPIASTSTSTPPSAKKIKTEWDEPASDALSKRQAEVEGVKTEEDAVKFLEQVSSWLQMTNESDGQDNLKTEIAESLDEILRGYPVAADDGMSLSFIDSINVGGSSSPRPAALDPAEFFDFTLYGLPEEDAGSKADTPDLVQASSSVGPSPGSASETEVHLPASASTGADIAKIADPKSEPPSGGDSMSQDLWRAIDGGESAFYNSSDNWKWDQPMQPLEQPWAIYSSS